MNLLIYFHDTIIYCVLMKRTQAYLCVQQCRILMKNPGKGTPNLNGRHPKKVFTFREHVTYIIPENPLPPFYLVRRPWALKGH